MRIVAGDLRGRVIDSPSGDITRPTTDRVRESMFSSIYSRLGDLDGACVLDAFAGSGALGIEALSRGAKSCVFFEQDRKARRVLEGNLKSLGLSAPRAQVVGSDVLEPAAHARIADGGARELVLLDPPYAYEPAAIADFVESLRQAGAIGQGSVIVYEHDLKNKQEAHDVFEDMPGFKVTGQKKYGKIGVTYIECA